MKIRHFIVCRNICAHAKYNKFTICIIFSRYSNQYYYSAFFAWMLLIMVSKNTLERSDLFWDRLFWSMPKCVVPTAAGCSAAAGAPSMPMCCSGPGKPLHTHTAPVVGGTCCMCAHGFPVWMGVGRIKSRLRDCSPCQSRKTKERKKIEKCLSCVWLQWYLSKPTLRSAVVLPLAGDKWIMFMLK